MLDGWAEPAGVEANQYSEDPSRKHGRAGGRPVFFIWVLSNEYQ